MRSWRRWSLGAQHSRRCCCTHRCCRRCGRWVDAETASVDAAGKAMARRKRRRARGRSSRRWGGRGVIGWRRRRSMLPTSARCDWRGVEMGEGRRCAGTKRITGLARGEKLKKGIRVGCC
ncbi:hypothetical protein SORBI_3008G035633 [Sorghum bicolor]|uniref:Uncharacterized protein n=1 Tax=Sorghum bicolor TaxID=4558 RepID=A0A1Z5R4L0_SORBI|nr:hypothetical protein SORBI_3008G035633 [Sorghum bicolor]